MAAEIKEIDSLFSVKLSIGGRINITLDGFTEAELVELKKLIDATLEKKEKKTAKSRLWNPRSKRLEEVNDEE